MGLVLSDPARLQYYLFSFLSGLVSWSLFVLDRTSSCLAVHSLFMFGGTSSVLYPGSLFGLLTRCLFRSLLTTRSWIFRQNDVRLIRACRGAGNPQVVCLFLPLLVVAGGSRCARIVSRRRGDVFGSVQHSRLSSRDPRYCWSNRFDNRRPDQWRRAEPLVLLCIIARQF